MALWQEKSAASSRSSPASFFVYRLRVSFLPCSRPPGLTHSGPLLPSSGLVNSALIQMLSRCSLAAAVSCSPGSRPCPGLSGELCAVECCLDCCCTTAGNPFYCLPLSGSVVQVVPIDRGVCRSRLTSRSGPIAV